MTTAVHTTGSARTRRRERAHAATAEEIKTVARGQLGRDGSSSINLRAVAREMGIAPSALYRYFPSRDDILTALITDAYNDLGETVERSVADLDPLDAASQFLTATAAFRFWAKNNPAEFALLYGSPVPGYTAAEETKPSAMRTSDVLTATLEAGLASGGIEIPFSAKDIPPRLRKLLATVALSERQVTHPAETTAVGLLAWTSLLGILVCEIFSHWPPAMDAGADAFFEFSMRRVLAAIGTDPAVIAKAKLVRLKA